MVDDAHEGISMFLDIGLFFIGSVRDRKRKKVWVHQCRGQYLTCELVIAEGTISVIVASLHHGYIKEV